MMNGIAHWIITALVVVGLYLIYRRGRAIHENRGYESGKLSDWQLRAIIVRKILDGKTDLEISREDMSSLRSASRDEPETLLALATLGDADAIERLKSEREHAAEVLDGKVRGNEVRAVRYLIAIGTPEHLPSLMRVIDEDSIKAIEEILKRHARDCNSELLRELADQRDSVSYRTTERIFDPATDEWPKYEERVVSIDCVSVKTLARAELRRRGL